MCPYFPSQNAGSPPRVGVPEINRRLRTAQSVSWIVAKPAQGAGWALMIIGFGLVGGAMRRRRGHFAQVV